MQDTQGTTPAANIMQNPLPTHAPQSATPSNPVNTLDEAGPRFDPSVLIRNVQQMKGITQECKDFEMTHCVSIHPSTPPPHSYSGQTHPKTHSLHRSSYQTTSLLVYLFSKHHHHVRPIHSSSKHHHHVRPVHLSSHHSPNPMSILSLKSTNPSSRPSPLP